MGIGGKSIQAVATRVKLKIGHLPTREYEVLITPIKEWIIGSGPRFIFTNHCNFKPTGSHHSGNMSWSAVSSWTLRTNMSKVKPGNKGGHRVGWSN